MFKRVFLSFVIGFTALYASAQTGIEQYNLVWDKQSLNSSESMPCGGGDIGLNVWVEGDELLFYMSRSGTFDENNTLLKLGRVRLKLSPNPFSQDDFKQALILKDGHVDIRTKKGSANTHMRVWVDVFRPVVHVDVNSETPLSAEASYESWRHIDQFPKGKENNANSYKWAPPTPVITFKDSVRFDGNQVMFYHQNRNSTAFDVVVKQQGMESVKDQMMNPIAGLCFGGLMQGANMTAAGTYLGRYHDTDFKGWKLKSRKPSKSHQVTVYLPVAKANEVWTSKLKSLIQENQKAAKIAKRQTQNWWKNYWERSYIYLDSAISSKSSTAWQVGRNYQLFRYMLGCNAYGEYPTKFNGGLFTVDPSFTDATLKFTPDFRNWGGGTHTAQNQRLVYWPMLRSGDIDMMKPQFDFYNNMLRNAELRSEFYWNHKGASFTEQIENFGLPNPAEYNWKRPADYDKGMEHNAWLEYQWDTVLEFCQMIIETHRYQGKDIKEYIPLIESSLTFFNEHYQYLAKKRGSKTFDANGHLVLYPGSSAETYKMAYNATSTISALQVVLQSLLELPDDCLTAEKREAWSTMLKHIPPISFREQGGHPTISPAKLWERINNTETPQLYPVYPWGIYGIGRSGLDTAINTYKYDADALKFRSHIGWKQDNIFAARLGLKDEAQRLTTLKLKDSGRRFPAFWGPGFDWTPDHNWGGSGMIGLQEMLMQTDGRKIYLLPAWPSDWNASFKLHAPYKTTIEAIVTDGKITSLKVSPESRKKDVEVLNTPHL
ncbi:hypothetical protein B0I27_101575 [Arcticibacter pallidicorallinus]|uniref:DUF5703 domain-containing protein n=1 Tax=Arcticibacter pallidicorallinus TaxID=1259464 RepID=A0A2T0UCD1_9SPHI|nr:DUF5703 domain-containing protein [Arcticibacter pallidicorallinus]PRY55601.1 hypothetical protein B0I27_101575 [Arcticibacter pallidicorallinus]